MFPFAADFFGTINALETEIEISQESNLAVIGCQGRMCNAYRMSLQQYVVLVTGALQEMCIHHHLICMTHTLPVYMTNFGGDISGTGH